MPELDETENEYRYRIRDPNLFVEGMFRSKDLPAPGLRLVLGRLKSSPEGSSVVQSVRFQKKNWDRTRALAWVAEHKSQFTMEPANLFSVSNVEIFSVGKWNGKKITQSDLDSIVDAFSKTKKSIRPFLKLGHDDDQKIIQSDGLPAAGWVENIRRSGGKLLADFVDIPKKVFQLIKNKGYRKVSVELFSNIEIENQRFPKMLGAVALLGSDLPGVLNLDDILSMYSLNNDFSTLDSFTSKENSDTIISNDIFSKDNREFIEMSDELKFKIKAEQERSDKLEKKNESLDLENKKLREDFKKLSDSIADKDKKILEIQHKEKIAQVEKFITEMTSEKICTKAMQPLIKELLIEDREKYSIDKVEYTKPDLLKKILKFAVDGSKVNFEDSTGDQKEGNSTSHEAIEKYALDHKVTYDQAYRELHRKH